MPPGTFCRKFHALQKRSSAFFSYLVPFELRSRGKEKISILKVFFLCYSDCLNKLGDL
jgi:hypothetical protein